MYNVVVKNNLGKVIAKDPVVMTLEMAMDFADASAITYRKENAYRYESSNITQYPYCSIEITSGTSKWWKWYPLSRDLTYSEC